MDQIKEDEPEEGEKKANTEYKKLKNLEQRTPVMEMMGHTNKS